MGGRDILRASLIVMMSASAHAQVSGLNTASLPATPPNVVSPPVPVSTALSLPQFRDRFGADPRAYVPDQRPFRQFPFFPIYGNPYFPYGYVDEHQLYDQMRNQPPMPQV